MNLAIIGFVLMLVLMFVLIKDKLTPTVAFILLPLVSDLYNFIMPSIAVLAIVAFGIAFLISKIEIRNGAGIPAAGLALEGDAEGSAGIKNRKLYGFNLVVTIIMLVLLFVDIGLPLHLIFMISFCIALTVNFPKPVP